MPLGNALLSIRVEVLLLLVEESLRLYGISLFWLEFFDYLGLFRITLSLDESSQFLCPLSFFFLLLLFGQLELLITNSPELSEIFVLLNLWCCLLLFTLNLKSSAALNSLLHIGFSLLLLSIEFVSFVFSFGNLSVQYLFLVILKLPELFDLTVNHALSLSLFSLESFILAFLLHLVTLISLLGKLVDLLFLLYFLKELSLFRLKLIFVRFSQVCSDLCSPLLPGNLFLFLSFKIFFNLSLDKFTFKKLLLDLFDVTQFERFKLITDVLWVLLSEVILLLELLFHLFVILDHLLFFNFLPVFLNLIIDLLLPVLKSFLCLLLLSDVTKEHFWFQGLNHVLTFMHVQVSLLNGLSP